MTMTQYQQEKLVEACRIMAKLLDFYKHDEEQVYKYCAQNNIGDRQTVYKLITATKSFIKMKLM